ncbi:response regulator transcription factor [Algibacter miyuki]|uniref:Response regulator transcription factor n=1 Tax=Algibacter miyuki TaxID=1306933 RepID=A0ABV5GWS7_9FLAO|nr:response regulator transcription factor [Algibacter miyuki]MDN3664310.1 response regulator transcription factor [Algibacter miyuki]
MLEIRILIVEDDPIICEDIKGMLSNVNYNTIGVAYSKDDAIEAIDTLRPDLVLIDINLEGDYEGFLVAEHINNTKKIPFLYLTSYSGKQVLDRAKKTLPMGYVVKPFNEKELYSTIEIALYNFSKFVLPVALNRDNINSLIQTPLTQKEFEILKGLQEGKTNQLLAEGQFVSVNTIKSHIKNIYEKMNTHTRLETITLLNELLR